MALPLGTVSSPVQGTHLSLLPSLEHNIWRPNVMFAAAKKGARAGEARFRKRRPQSIAPSGSKITATMAYLAPEVTAGWTRRRRPGSERGGLCPSPLRAVRSRPPWRVWPQRSRQAGLGGAGGGSERVDPRPLSVRAAGPWRPETSVGADDIQSALAAPCERARPAVLHGPGPCYAGSFGPLPSPPCHIATGTLPHCQARRTTLPDSRCYIARDALACCGAPVPYCPAGHATLPKSRCLVTKAAPPHWYGGPAILPGLLCLIAGGQMLHCHACRAGCPVRHVRFFLTQGAVAM